MMVVAGFMCVSGGAFASCDNGYYTMCSRDPENYDNCTYCECVPCDDGYTSNGLGVVYENECHMTSDSGCYWEPCGGYDSVCPAYLNSNYRCKELDISCPSTDCHVYSVCNSTNGEIVYPSFIDGCAYHIENGSECQPNTVSCNQFGIETNFALLGVQQSEQTGTASWNGDAWDTGACKLNATNKSVMSVGGLGIYCDNFNIVAEVTEENRYRTQSLLGQPVYYTLTRNYCKKCHAGYLPIVKQSPDMGLYLAPENVNSQYGVAFCSNMVSAPDYAPGCTITYPLDSNSMPTGCQMSCPDYMETRENGEISIDACVPDGNHIYSDGTGDFTLGTEPCN